MSLFHLLQELSLKIVSPISIAILRGIELPLPYQFSQFHPEHYLGCLIISLCAMLFNIVRTRLSGMVTSSLRCSFVDLLLFSGIINSLYSMRCLTGNQ